MPTLKWYTETKGWKNWVDLPYWAKYEILLNACSDYDRYKAGISYYPEITNVLLVLFTRAPEDLLDSYLANPMAYDADVAVDLANKFTTKRAIMEDYGFIDEMRYHMRS